MITKLVFKDGIEIVNEDCYPSINPTEDVLDICYGDGIIEASYELNSINEVVFVNAREN